MNFKPSLKGFLPVAIFLSASIITYVAIERWRSSSQESIRQNSIENLQTVDRKTSALASSGEKQKETIEGLEGLSEGEVIVFPQLRKLDGQIIDLDRSQEKYLLFAFFASRCPSCTQDAELWKDLNRVASERGVAFYLISVGDDTAEMERFISAYRLSELPILFDPDNRVGRELKVGIVPQYILLTSKGEVLKRWDGLQRYDKAQGAAKLAEFFQPINQFRKNIP